MALEAANNETRAVTAELCAARDEMAVALTGSMALLNKKATEAAELEAEADGEARRLVFDLEQEIARLEVELGNLNTINVSLQVTLDGERERWQLGGEGLMNERVRLKASETALTRREAELTREVAVKEDIIKGLKIENGDLTRRCQELRENLMSEVAKAQVTSIKPRNNASIYV